MLKPSHLTAQLVTAAAILLLLALSVGACAFYEWGKSSKPPQQETNQPANSHPKASANENSQSKSLWERLALILEKSLDDPIAFFTLILACFTGLLVIVSFIQIWFLIHADHLAEEAGQTAKESTNIARQALIAGQRAFISVNFRPSANLDINSGKVTQYSFTPVWYNAGETPTRDMSNHISIMLFPGDIPADWDFPDLWPRNVEEKDRRPIPLGAAPKASVDGQAVGVAVDRIANVIGGREKLYMWGWAKYRDVFPGTKKHVTRFAIKIEIGGDPSEPQKMSFSFPFLWKYNCSDEECDYQGYPVDWKARTAAD